LSLGLGGVVTYCGKCRAVTAGVTLCNDCSVALRVELTDVPSLLADLDITRSRQDQLVAPYDHGAASAETPLPYKPHIAETVWVLHHTLDAWATTLGVARHATRPLTTAQLAVWLLRNMNRVVLCTDAGQLADELTSAIHQARRAIDRPDDRRCFLGPCSTPDPTTGLLCQEEVYGLPWNRYATCPTCGARHDIAERQTWLHDVAQDHLGTSVEIAGFLRSTGMRCTPSMIRNYAARGRLTPAPDTHPPLYRIRDVLTTLQARYQHQKTS
jgi:hypothetical protein